MTRMPVEMSEISGDGGVEGTLTTKVGTPVDCTLFFVDVHDVEVYRILLQSWGKV